MLFDYLTLSSTFSAHTAISPSILYEAEITGSQKSAFFANKYELQVHRNQLSLATKPDCSSGQGVGSANLFGKKGRAVIEFFVMRQKYTSIFASCIETTLFFSPLPYFPEERNWSSRICGTISYWLLPVISSPKQ